ncbi:MAG TPA: hypothetical protein VMT39_02365 [Candidatus Bathyarchaeia archaeon]|nr:hypothetical protein [Candidatus Bathyarchaeia archaeon]
MADLCEKDQQWLDEFVAKYQANATAACPACKGSGKVEDNDLPITRMVTCCDCGVKRWTRVAAEQRLLNIPSEYRGFTLDTLGPSPLSKLPPDRQARVIDHLKSHRADGYAFFGPPAIGKTVWTTALYSQALWDLLRAGEPQRWKHFPVWRISAKRLLDEHTEYAAAQFDDDLDRMFERPTVTAEKITHVRSGQEQTPRLFLEEIDKTKETEARRANLFSVLDALMASGGQLVVNSNLRPREFSERFGEDLWWRLQKTCTVMDLF